MLEATLELVRRKKVCSVCKEEKFYGEFSLCKSKADGRQSTCKLCRSLQQKTEKAKRTKNNWYHKNREKIQASHQNIKEQWRQLRYAAKTREIPLEISFEEFQEIRSRPCAYCEGPLPLYGGGIDRIDPYKGYTKPNCNPCCHQCNYIFAKKSKEEIYKHLEKMLALASKNRVTT